MLTKPPQAKNQIVELDAYGKFLDKKGKSLTKESSEQLVGFLKKYIEKNGAITRENIEKKDPEVLYQEPSYQKTEATTEKILTYTPNPLSPAQALEKLFEPQKIFGVFTRKSPAIKSLTKLYELYMDHTKGIPETHRPAEVTSSLSITFKPPKP